MAQRFYWVPHTICFFGCEHCHNDSVMAGIKAQQRVIDGVIANLPAPTDPDFPLSEMLVGGGEALMRNQEMEYLVRAFRQRFPQGPEQNLSARRAGGHAILALQTMGMPLADRFGNPSSRQINYWLDLGVDYFHIASNDIFHEQQRPDYPWDYFRAQLQQYGAEHGISFMIYGKGPARLVPSGRVLDHLPELEHAGAALLTDAGYCASSWEAGKNFLSGQQAEHPDCSEVVIDPHGWVHPCCWHELAPGLFNLSITPFAQGIARARQAAFCQAIDRGDIIGMAELSGISPHLAQQVRAQVGECGLCRLASVRLVAQPEQSWLKPTNLSAREIRFYEQQIGPAALCEVLADPGADRHSYANLPDTA